MNWRSGIGRRAVPALALPLAGCFTVGPDFVPPEPEVRASFAAPLPEQFAQGPAVDEWWALFDDPVLFGLVQRGLTDNLDVLAAASRVREASALVDAAEAELFPTLDFEGDVTGQSETRRGGSSGEDTLSASAEAAGVIGWDLDVFGGLRRAEQAAMADAAEAVALTREARRVVAAGIARSYVELRAAQRRLALTEQSLELQEQTLRVVSSQVDAGLAPGLDAFRARAEVADLRADLGPLRAEAGQFANALAVLVGDMPGTLAPDLAVPGPIPTAAANAAIGAPTDVIRRRPDIRAAEFALASATAEVGVEAADLYPSFSLPGTLSIGVSGLGTGTLVTTVLRALSLAVDFPLFDAGLRRAEVTAAEERMLQAGLAYRATLLAALEEVEAALLDYQAALDRRDALTEVVANNRRAFDQSRGLYGQGLIDFLDVLDAQREWNDALQELALAERDLALAVVDTYAAIAGPPPAGGGAEQPVTE